MGINGAQHDARIIASESCDSQGELASSIPALLEKAAARDPPVKLRLLFVDSACFDYTLGDRLHSEVIPLDEALDAQTAVIGDGRSDPKTRHVAKSVAYRRPILAVGCGALGATHEAVANLDIIVAHDVLAAGLRVKKGEEFCSGSVPPRAVMNYAAYAERGFTIAQTLEEARDAIVAGKSLVVKPTLDADHLIFWLRQMFPELTAASVSRDTDYLSAMGHIFHEQSTSRYLYLASEYEWHPAVSVLWMAHKLCGGNDYMPSYVPGCHRTNVSSEAMRDEVAELLAKAAAGPPEAVPSLDHLFKMVEATRAQQQDIVFALIMYLNGACYLEDGHIRRMFEATLALGTERAIREATERMEVLRAAAVYSTVEAVVSAMLESPDSLEQVKRVVEELKATEPPRHALPMSDLVELELGRVAAVRESTRGAFRTISDMLDEVGATGLCALVEGAAADAAMRGYADAALGFAERGSVFDRDAEAALLSLRQSAEKEMRRLMDLRACAVRLRSAVADATWASQRVGEVTRSTLEALSAHASLSDLRNDLKTVFDQCAAETKLDRFVGVLRHVLAGGLRLDRLHAIERAASVMSTALDRASRARSIVDGVIDQVRYFKEWCVGGTAAYVALQTLLGSGDAATEGSLDRLFVEDLDTVSRALVPITQQALLADEPSVREVLNTFHRTVLDVLEKLDAADTPSACRRALVIRVADIARRPYVAEEAVRRHTDALRAALSGASGTQAVLAQAVLASVVERCDTATDAASVELRGRIVAVLGALVRGADDVELRLAAAEAAAAAACRDVLALGSQLERVADIARRPYVARGAVRREADALRVALRGDAGALAVLASVVGRCDSATDAASDALRGALVAALGALARGAEDVESRLAAAEAAAVSACRDVGALGSQLERVAVVARRPGAALGLSRRHTDALRATLSGDATAQAALASVDARCGTATDAASVALRGPLIAALGALARGAENVESRLAAAEAAAAAACRDVWTLGAQLARVASALERARAAPGARTALPAALSDLRTALAAASDAARTTVTMHAPAALRAIAANDAAAAETELAAMETAVDSVLSAAATLAKAVADATQNSPEATQAERRSAAAIAQRARERAERAAQSGAANATTDPIARFLAAIQRPASSAGPYQGRSTMVDLAVMPQQHALRELDHKTEIINFVWTKGVDSRNPPHCVMCGAFDKGPLTSANVDGVEIKKRMNQVCQCCKGANWKHVATGSYFRFCMRCKKFHDIHKFAQGDGDRESLDPFTTPKCAACRAANRAAYHKKKQRLKK